MDTNSALLLVLSKLTNKTPVYYNSDAYYQAYKNQLKKEIGLNYSLDAVQNINGFQQDLEDNIIYQRRFQTGLEWSILKEGYFDSKNKIEYLKYQQLVDEQLNFFKDTKKSDNIKMNQTIFWFNKYKLTILEKRRQLLAFQVPVIEQLYFAKKINKEIVLKNQTKQAEVNGLNSIYASYNQFVSLELDSSIFLLTAPLFDINYAVFLEDVKNDSSLDSVSRFLLLSLEKQQKWYHDVRLKTFLRYNYYDLIGSNPASRSFFTTGFNLNIPLPFTYKEQRKVEAEKISKQIESVHQHRNQQKIELINLAYEFRYQLKQYIVFHQKKIMTNESIRQERVKAALGDVDFNPLHGLQLLDEQLQIEIELLDLKQNLYIKLLKIHEMLPHLTIDKLVVPIELPNYFDFEDDVNRNCYVWTKTFEHHSVDFLYEYILYNQFDGIQLAVSKEDKFVKEKLDLMQRLTAKGIKVDLMIGQNELLNSTQFTTELSALISPYPIKSVHGIHLDIEPHTRPDWKANQEKLKEKFLLLVEETKKLTQTYNIMLSVDVPLSIDTIFARSIIEKVNILRFMAYENIKEDYLLRKLTAYKSNFDKVALAFRTEDFSSRNELEEFAKKILTTLDLKNLNLHDLNRLIELDKKSLIQDEKH